MSGQSDFSLHSWNGDKETIKRYAELLSHVYKRPVSENHLWWKHGENPIGKSLITYAENESGDMVAARAFWPMFSEKGPIYQPCDTVTRNDYQRRGLFSKLTKMCLEQIEADASVVNFPNNNSYPAYLKLGWQCYSKNRKVFGISLFSGGQNIDNLDNYLSGRVSPKTAEYLNWRFSHRSGIEYSFRQHKHGFVVSNGKTQGLVALHSMDEPYGAAGVSSGYVLENSFSLLKNLFLGRIALPCNSRTAFYLPPGASSDALKQLFSMAQINTLMDTF